MAQHQCCKPPAQTPINQQTCPISSPGQTPAVPQPLTFPRYSPSVPEDLSQGGTHIFSFAPGLSHLLSACSSWKKYEILSKDLLKSIQNANLCVLLHQCFATWDGSATSSAISHGLWGQTPHKANLKNLKALEMPEKKWGEKYFQGDAELRPWKEQRHLQEQPG